MSAGACVITLDLDHYGFKIPVMPINGEHYIGIKLDDTSLNETFKKIKYGEYDIKAIAEKGREWVLKHYSPLNTAQHFIDSIDSINNN